MSGQNVIAFKAHNSAGGGFSVFAVSGSVSFTPAAVPDSASTAALLVLALPGLIALRRRSPRA
ncbi:MAG: VPDSG-CTERM sorting domain-containing protein [Verrucomicrobia bacterium]|nr:VPDSG-CTERM sorting domain-containing protein [Verrucomicrobiota bacterium]